MISFVKDLPRNATICFEIFDCDPTVQGKEFCIGATSVEAFEPDTGMLRSGPFDLKVWPEQRACLKYKSETPGVLLLDSSNEIYKKERLVKLSKKYREAGIVSSNGIDRITFAQIEMINQQEKIESNMLFLSVEFQRFRQSGQNVAMVYFEKNGHLINEVNLSSEFNRCPDFEIGKENLVEAKHHKLTRSARVGQLDKGLKPNAETRNRLIEIVGYPSTRALSREEEDLIWKYRYYLSNDKKALSKFVRCISWENKSEASIAMELIINTWAKMDVEDALELLGPEFRYQGLRQYAIGRLRETSDGDLALYLLQLVQALKYERISPAWLNPTEVELAAEIDSLSVSQGAMEDSQDSSGDEASLPPNTMTVDKSLTESDLIEDEELATDGGLAGFLIERSCSNKILANYLFWYLTVETEEPKEPYPMASPDEKRRLELYKSVFKRYNNTLKRTRKQEVRNNYHMLNQQTTFMKNLNTVMSIALNEPGNRQKKIEKLQSILEDEEYGMLYMNPTCLPLDPDIEIHATFPDLAILFKSSLMPARITFLTTVKDTVYTTLYKNGDDLRQDQLVLQIITLMDRILQQENLDLKLTPYKVLATSTNQGFVQYVHSKPIATVLKEYKTIANFFKKDSATDSTPYGFSAEIMDNYVRSCAGYCVITYILGVGDRHHDNLLLTDDGKMFHIDFGYILGRDPKPLPPLMKLSREMIDVFGGQGTDLYKEFKQKCFTTFLTLRRHSNLILNLFSLMVDASVQDIAQEPDKTVKKVLDKFRHDLNDEEAVSYLSGVIDQCANAVMAAIVERLHDFSQNLRN